MLGLTGIILCIALAASALTLLGLLGPRVRCPPHCARCRFDLSGHDVDRSLTPITCPECSLLIATPYQVRRTRREPHRARLTAGLTLAGFTLVSAVTMLVASGGSMDLYTIVSNKRLFKMADRGSERAIYELSARAQAGQFSEADHDRLRQRAVDQARQPVMHYNDTWYRILRESFDPNETSPQEAAECLVDMLDLQLSVPQEIARGDRLMFRVNGTVWFGPRDGWMLFQQSDVEARAIRINGQEAWSLERGTRINGSPNIAIRRGLNREDVNWYWRNDPDLPVLDLPVGATVDLEVDLRVRETAYALPCTFSTMMQSFPEGFDFTLSTTFTIAPPTPAGG